MLNRINMKTLTLQVAQISKEMGLLNDLLVTRPTGRHFQSLVKEVLEKPTLQTVILDFAGIRLMDASFADEVFGNIASERSRREATYTTALFLRSLEEASLENLDMALSSRTRREKNLRNSVIPHIQPDNTIKLLGKWEKHVEETFTLLVQKIQLTTHELVDLLKIDIGAASTRLKVLYDLGLASRSETRNTDDKQYIYCLPLE